MPLSSLLPWRVAEARRSRKTAPATTPATTPANSGTIPARSGFVQGVPPGGLNENQLAVGASTQTDRRTLLVELWEAYLSCPWAFAAVNAIARTVTAGGITMKWDGDTGEDAEQPPKPPGAEAFERLLAFCNPVSDIRQLMRNVVADLLVFGDAYLEISWLGKIPVAIWNLDCPTTSPRTDDHGNVTGWVQTTDFGQTAEFEPHEVIHISLDSARPGVFGVSPVHAAMIPIKTWLFAAACEKEMFRKGLPANVHMDFPAGKSEAEIQRWVEQYRSENLGPANIGTPLTSKGGAVAKELQTGKITDILQAKKDARDEVLSTIGTPPAKVGVIESGNLGGGTGTAQDVTYRLDTCAPIGWLITEKLQFALAVQAFGVEDWHAEFGTVDYRDEQDVEQIRDTRLRNGSWTLNRYRAEIGEPPVDGGDDAILVDRQNLVLWSQMAARSQAGIAAMAGKGGSGVPPLPAAPPPGETLPQAQVRLYRARLAEMIRTLPREPGLPVDGPRGDLAEGTGRRVPA